MSSFSALLVFPSYFPPFSIIHGTLHNNIAWPVCFYNNLRILGTQVVSLCKLSDNGWTCVNYEYLCLESTFSQGGLTYWSKSASQSGSAHHVKPIKHVIWSNLARVFVDCSCSRPRSPLITLVYYHLFPHHLTGLNASTTGRILKQALKGFDNLFTLHCRLILTLSNSNARLKFSTASVYVGLGLVNPLWYTFWILTWCVLIWSHMKTISINDIYYISQAHGLERKGVSALVINNESLAAASLMGWDLWAEAKMGI